MSENGEAPRLQQVYENEIRPALTEQFGYTNQMQTPRLTKIVLNMGVGEGSADKKKIEAAVREVAGEVIERIAWRIRMYEFLDRLVTIALPRVRDFRGLSSKSFDGRGNYALGLKEQIVFPEIDYDTVDEVRGMNIVICTSAETNDEGRALLSAFQLPLVI